jgi:hypothetical protein
VGSGGGVVSTRVDLKDVELVLLDGQCSGSVQAVVDQAKARLAMVARLGGLTAARAGFVADVVGYAAKHGELRFSRTRMRRCAVCSSAPVPPYVLYKSGPRRGKPNYDTPQYLDGIDFGLSFVKMDGWYPELGCCACCVDVVQPCLVAELENVPAQLPARLTATGVSRWSRCGNRRCTQCGWTGHEGQMRRGRTVMGDGTYPAGCPECPAANLPLGRSLVEVADGFTMVEVQEVLQ